MTSTGDNFMASEGWIDLDHWPGAWIDWGADRLPEMCFFEPLEFHDRYMEDSPTIDFTFPSDEDLGKIETALSQLLPQDFRVLCHVEGREDDMESNAAVICFEIEHKKFTAREWNALESDSDIFDIFWPAFAVLVNVLDPGTFNSPYLFSAHTLKGN